MSITSFLKTGCNLAIGSITNRTGNCKREYADRKYYWRMYHWKLVFIISLIISYKGNSSVVKLITRIKTIAREFLTRGAVDWFDALDISAPRDSLKRLALSQGYRVQVVFQR